jgi:hypothetical protein
MCYSVKSSLQTTLLSFVSIVYLLSSNIPHYQWLGIALIGWCGMQFDELLLWLTEPQKECTKWNELITMTLIPFTLLSQPMFSLLGSLYVFPWNTLSTLRKQFTVLFTVICILIIYFIHFYKPDKTCTTVSENGHLLWITSNYVHNNNIFAYLWLIIISLPLILFWNKNFMLIILIGIIPVIGFQLGKYTDAQGSIWCYYTSYTSIIASIALFLHQSNIYKFLSF